MKYLSGRRSSSGISLTWRTLSAGRTLSLYAAVVGCLPFCKSNPLSGSPSSFATRNYSFRSFECLSFPFFVRIEESIYRSRYLCACVCVFVYRCAEGYICVRAHSSGTRGIILQSRGAHVGGTKRYGNRSGEFLRYGYISGVSIRNSNWKFKPLKHSRAEGSPVNGKRALFAVLTRN